MVPTKSIAWILAASLVLALAGCAECAPSDATPEPSANGKYRPAIELTVPGRVLVRDAAGYDDFRNPWTEAYEDELGITLVPKWTAAAAENVTLSEQLAAGVVPDLMPGLGRAEFELVVRLGLAADMGDLVDRFASPLTKEILHSDGGYSIQSSTIDGKLYALPHVYGNTDNIPMMWIRTDWLRELGLEVPKTQDDLEAVLEAFVRRDPDGNGVEDTFGLCSTGSLWEFGAVFNMFGAQPFWSWYYDGYHRLRYSTVSFVPQMKEALAYLQRLYRAGLVYPEFGVLPADRYYRTFADGKAGVAFEYKYLPLHIQEDAAGGRVTAEWKAYPLPTALPGGQPARPFSYHGPAAYNVVSSKCRYPEAAIRMLDLYTEKVHSDRSDDSYDRFVQTPGGVSVERYAVFRMSVANDLSEFDDIAAAVEAGDPAGLTRSEAEKYRLCIQYEEGDLTRWADYQYYGPGNATVTVIRYYSTAVTPFFSDYYGPEPQSAGLYFGQLNSRWLETCTRIIMGDADVGIYDDFVRAFYSLGGQQAEDELNAMVAAATVTP